MPYIDAKLSIAVSDDKKDTLKSEFGKLITLIPGKTEQALMVGIQDNYTLYQSGIKKDKTAFIEVKTYKDSNASVKEQMVQGFCNLCDKELGIPASNIYVTFHGFDEWGYHGSLLK